MEIFGFYIGKKKDLEAQCRQKAEIELSQRVNLTIEELVGKEITKLKEDLRIKKAELARLQKLDEIHRKAIDDSKNKHESLKNRIQDLEEGLYRANEKVCSHVIEITEPYVKKDASMIINLLRNMEGNYSVHFMKSFFKTLYDIDSVISQSQPWEPYGLKLIYSINEGVGQIDIRIIRAFTLFSADRLRGFKGKLNLFAKLEEMAKKKDFSAALRYYDQNWKHKDYVLNLTKAERDLIIMKQKNFSDSWENLLPVVGDDRGDTTSLSVYSEPAFSRRYVKKLMDYESKNGIILRVDEKDF